MPTHTVLFDFHNVPNWPVQSPNWLQNHGLAPALSIAVLDVAMEGEYRLDGERERSLEPVCPSTQQPFPWLIISLILLVWSLFIFSLYKNNCPGKTPRNKCLLHGVLGRFSFQPLDENIQFGPSAATLVDLGCLGLNFEKKRTKKWHILSSIFFHAGLADLILDTISLSFMGAELEEKFGIVKIGSLYLLSSLAGSLWASSFKFDGAVYVGGSSGVCGLTGGAFAELIINANMHDEKLKRFLRLCLGVAINFAIKLTSPWADVSGNIGGLYLGFLIGFLLLIRCHPESTGYNSRHSDYDPQQRIMHYSWYQKALWLLALMSTIIQSLDSLFKLILR